MWGPKQRGLMGTLLNKVFFLLWAILPTWTQQDPFYKITRWEEEERRGWHSCQWQVCLWCEMQIRASDHITQDQEWDQLQLEGSISANSARDRKPLSWRQRKAPETQLSHNPPGVKTWSSSCYELTVEWDSCSIYLGSQSLERHQSWIRISRAPFLRLPPGLHSKDCFQLELQLFPSFSRPVLCEFCQLQTHSTTM